MELLAPAGNLETLKIAYNAGADACYFGGTQFSARAYSGNFTRDEIQEALEYAHLRKKRLYAAINIMLYNNELTQALEEAEFLAKIGVDGIIAADLGFIGRATKEFPIPIHGSTQMGIHTKTGAQTAKRLGLKRIVLARETSLEAIREIQKAGIETEVFVHGALCSSVSGMCLMSSIIGGRSGNRGRCAQPCRLPYTIGGNKAFHLSMADLCAQGLLWKLKDAGVASLKIEGRMKRPEYVGIVVREYRKALKAMATGQPFDQEKSRKELLKIYNRGGFCTGYLEPGREVTYPARENHAGIFVGTVEKIGDGKAWIKAKEPLEKGDGIEFMGKCSHGGLTLSYADPIKGGFRIKATKEAQTGDSVFLTTDASQLKEATFPDPFTIPVQMTLWIEEGEPARLLIQSGKVATEVAGQILQAARQPMEEERIKNALLKTGGTNVSVETICIQKVGNPFLPISQLNELRRRGIETLKNKVIEKNRLYSFWKHKTERAIVATSEEMKIAAKVANSRQLRGAYAAGIDTIYFEPEKYFEQIVNNREELAGALQEMSNSVKVFLCLPPYLREEEESALRKQADGLFDGILAGSIGQIRHGDHTDIWLNIANTDAAEEARRLGAEIITISAELGASQIQQIENSGKQAVVYGNLPVMNLVHCPFKRAVGCGKCKSEKLIDRKGYRFPYKRLYTGHCLVQLLNPVLTAYTDIPALKRSGIAQIRLDFYTETAERVQKLVQAYKSAVETSQIVQLEGIIKETTTKGALGRSILLE